ncbi:ribonuclease H-like domain-containing protein [Chytriomyces sp. MP71]|nr:ribonuclease H-like domain-containing protein [Chytriomyces sp. MP71]
MLPTSPSTSSAAAAAPISVPCDRCRTPFTPKLVLTPADRTACTYHPQRAYMQATPGQAARTRLHPCCGGDTVQRGCCTGAHVFKESMFAVLHARIPFAVLPETGVDGVEVLKAVGVDCEMSYTAGGMECTRVSVVALDGSVVVDELVKPQYPVVDLNTQWSGVTDLSTAKYTLSQLHTLLASRGITRRTILIGHGLENDLNALRLLHARCIDTAILVPKRAPAHAEPRPGVVWKHSLRVLVERLLGRRIQTGVQAAGHDSAEDARAAVEVCLFCVREMSKGRTVAVE